MLPVIASPSFLFRCNNISSSVSGHQEKQVGVPCDGCEIFYVDMPKQLSPIVQINPPGEPGEPLEMSGVIYHADQKTPAKDIILYVYHTNQKGYYEPSTDQNPESKRHGHLRGWMKTNADGAYKFKTIKPGVYPQRSPPAHIHPIIKEPGKSIYYIDEYVFKGEYKVDDAYKANEEKRGGSGIIELKKNSSGVWIGKRDLVLGLNIPQYS